MMVFLKLAYQYIDIALCAAICKTMDQLFKRCLGSVLQKCLVNAFDATKFWCIFFLAILKTNPFSHHLSIKKVQLHSKFGLFALFLWLCRVMQGYVGLSRAIYGYVGPCRAMYSYVELCRAMYGYVGLCMAMWSCVWLCMVYRAVYGSVGLCRSVQGYVWLYMDMQGYILTNVKPLYDAYTTYLPFFQSYPLTSYQFSNDCRLKFIFFRFL